MITFNGRGLIGRRGSLTDTTLERPDVVPEESPVLDALEQFAQFVDEVVDSKQPGPIYWEGNPNRIAIRSVARVLCKWRHAYKSDRPPFALVVRLARDLPNVLIDVAGHPKRILQRRRAMEPINRLRELDSSCVRWLTRQPGNTLAEKSGHRRAVLAVQRYESVDTLENRVVRDLLKRCAALARDYLRQHQTNYPNHDWIRNTADFLKLCRRLESLPQLQEASGLPSFPKPNYVLLHETRYKQIWRAYTEVIRQQRRRQQLWTWRHQVYADMATIAWMNAASKDLFERQTRKAAHRFELRIRETPLRGTFFDWTGLPPAWNLSHEGAFYIGPMESACDVAKLVKSSGINIDLAKLANCIDTEDQAAFVTTWNRAQCKAAKLVVTFADVVGRAESLGNIRCRENEAILTLVDCVTGKQLIQHAVPLALIKHPDSLGTLHREWCLS